MRRQHRSEFVKGEAGCNRCSWRISGKNALALAAKHHDTKHHEAWAEITQRTIYGGQPAAVKQPRML